MFQTNAIPRTLKIASGTRIRLGYKEPMDLMRTSSASVWPWLDLCSARLPGKHTTLSLYPARQYARFITIFATPATRLSTVADAVMVGLVVLEFAG